VAHAELQVLPDCITLVPVEVVADQVDEPDLAVLGDRRLDGGGYHVLVVVLLDVADGF
jgi:hypothetical protein